MTVIIQFLRFNPPCLMDICFDAKHLSSCKYPSDRALGIIFFNGLNNYKYLYIFEWTLSNQKVLIFCVVVDIVHS